MKCEQITACNRNCTYQRFWYLNALQKSLLNYCHAFGYGFIVQKCPYSSICSKRIGLMSYNSQTPDFNPVKNFSVLTIQCIRNCNHSQKTSRSLRRFCVSSGKNSTLNSCHRNYQGQGRPHRVTL